MHPLKNFNFCPKCGSNNFSPSEGTSKKCNACGFKFFLNPTPSATAIIEDEKGRILMTVRGRDPRKGMMGLPGGFIDIDETAEQAMAREVKEELGLEVAELKYMTTFTNIYPFEGHDNHTLDLYFICKVKTFDGMTPMDDVAELIFMPKNEIDFEKLAFPSTQKAVAYYLDLTQNQGII